MAEALQLRFVAQSYDDEKSFIGVATANAESPLSPFKKNRRYLDYYISSDRLRDYGCHMQLYLDPRVQESFIDELDSSITGTISLVELTSETAEVRSILKDNGRDAIVVDLTTSDIKQLGLVAVRVLVPGFLPNFAAGFPQLNSESAKHFLSIAVNSTPRTWPLPH